MRTKLFTKLILAFALTSCVVYGSSKEESYSGYTMAVKLYNSWDAKTQMFIDGICYKALKESQEKYPDKPFLRYCYHNYLIGLYTEQINKAGEY